MILRVMKAILLLFLFCPLFVIGQNQICNDLIRNDYESTIKFIDSFFVENNLDSLGENNIEVKTKEINLLIDALNKIACVDSVYYVSPRIYMLPTIIATDIILETEVENSTQKYLITLLFKNYTQVVKLTELD